MPWLRSQAINCGNGKAPLCRATSRPFLNRIRLGIERIPNCADNCWFASLSSCTTCWKTPDLSDDTKTCGSELARDEDVKFNISVDWHTVIASKHAPTGSVLFQMPWLRSQAI